jgi:hypothetical protein
LLHDGQVSQNRQEDTPEDDNKVQTLPLRYLPQAKSEVRQNAGPVVLSQMLEPDDIQDFVTRSHR